MKKEEVKETILNPIEKDIEIKKLKKQIQGYKGQIAILQKSVEKKDKTIDDLSIQVFNLERFDEKNQKDLLEAREYIASLEDTIEKYEHPWWKRIFG